MHRLLMFVVLLLSSLCTKSVAAELPRTPMTVDVGLFVIDITNFNQQENTFDVELDVVTGWQDPRRGFELADNEGTFRMYKTEKALEELAKGWAPELYILNTVGAPSLGVVRTRIDADGTVVNRARLRGTLRATLDFRKFPFDVQALPIHIESLMWSADQLRIAHDESFSGFGADYEMPEWTLEDLAAEQQVVERPQEGQSYARITFLVQIDRKIGFYLWKILLPLLVITAITWVVFFMSEDALGRRAGVSSTGMLTVIAYQLILADSLPRFPYLTLMDKVALLTLVFIAMTMLENIVATRMEPEGRRRLDRACRVVFPVGYYASLALVLAPLLF